jgi:hypothetical protein
VSERDAGVPDAVAQAGGIKRWLRPAMNLVALVFVVVAAREMAKRWEGTAVTIAPWPAVIACLPLVAAVLLQGTGWVVLLERMAKRRIPRGTALEIALLSQLFRYMPGKVGLPIARLDRAPLVGLPRSMIGVGVIVEALSWAGTSAAVGFALLAITAPNVGVAGLLGKLALPAFSAAAIGLLVLLLVDRRVYPAKVRSLLAPDGTGPIVPALLPLIQVIYWHLVAAHGYLISRALGATPEDAVTGMGFYVVSQVAGFLVIAAPAGLGVREAVLVTGLAPFLGAKGALGAAVISRALSLVVEIVTWATVRMALRGQAGR